MEISDTRFKPETIDLLKNLIGLEWEGYGSEYLAPELDTAGTNAFLFTNGMTLEIVAYLKNLILGDEDEEYAALDVQIGTPSKSIHRRGNMSYLYKGQRIESVWIQENRVDCFGNEKLIFTYLSHDSIVLKFEKGWLGIAKYGMFTDEILFSSGKTINKLRLYNIHAEWESDLEIRFDTKSDLVKVE